MNFSGGRPGSFYGVLGNGRMDRIWVNRWDVQSLEDVNGRREGRRKRWRGPARRLGRKRKSNHAAWDKSFVALSDSQSINWCLLKPG